MKIAFRCDATRDIGFGHLSRCLALAEAFRLHGAGSVFAGQFDPSAEEQIAQSGFDYEQLSAPVNSTNAEKQAVDLLGQASAGGVVVDSYRVDEAYLSRLKAAGRRVVLIDDFNSLENYPCEAVLNFTWGASTLGYPTGPTLLLGPCYFPARRRLVEARPPSLERQRAGRVSNVLIAIGGSDPKRIAARLAGILRKRHGDICLRIVAADHTDLPGGLGGFAPGSMILPRQPDLSEQLLWADACVTGGGLIKYEGAFMGVPAAAISQNAGQASESHGLAAAGLVFDLGLADDRSDEQLADALDRFFADSDLRAAMMKSARQAFPPDPSGNAAGAILKAMGR